MDNKNINPFDDVSDDRNWRHKSDKLKKYIEAGANVYEGDLIYENLTTAEGIVFPEVVNGNVYLSNLKSAKGLVLPKYINGFLDLEFLHDAEGLQLCDVEDAVILNGLHSAKGLKIPYDFDLDKIQCEDESVLYEIKQNPTKYFVDLPEKKDINEKFYERRNTSLKEIYCQRMIELITRKLDLGVALDEDEIKFLNNARDKAIFFDVDSRYMVDQIEDLKKRVQEENGKSIQKSENVEYNGDLNFNKVTDASRLNLPKKLNGDLNLDGVTSAVGLVLPEVINGNLSLNGLTSAVGLVLPEVINGNLSLNGLTSAVGLVLPEVINGDLNLNGIISPEGLVLPKICKSIELNSLTSAEGLVFPDTIVGLLSLNSLTKPDGLVLPKDKVGELWLPKLVSADGLIIPKKIIEAVNLDSLQSAEGLKFHPGFDLDYIDCNDEIKEEIMNNPEKYYVIEEELEEDTGRGR